ncbi:MAG: DUF4440 domain-containing protein [Ginsengibacter sp.]
MKKNIFLCILSATLAISSCNDTAKNESTSTVATTDSSAAFDMSKTRASIDADNAKFLEEFKKGDSAALAAHYHSEGQVLMDHAEPVMRKDIASSWGRMMKNVADFKFATTDLVGNNDVLIETGTYEIHGLKDAWMDKGKYVVAWKKENGEWKIYRDIATTSMPEKK